MAVSASLDHVTVVTDDFEASRNVYDPVLSALGLLASVEYTDPELEDGDPGTVAAAGYGPPDRPPLLWLVAGPRPTTGAHVALSVADRDGVLTAHRAASAAGVRVIQPPRDWEQSQLNYFGVQFADPAGNLIEVTCRPFEPPTRKLP
jgi:catechol 2,3-dioxygenase-like lactoylglutathione lyase family enzyme